MVNQREQLLLHQILRMSYDEVTLKKNVCLSVFLHPSAFTRSQCSPSVRLCRTSGLSPGKKDDDCFVFWGRTAKINFVTQSFLYVVLGLLLNIIEMINLDCCFDY